MALSTPSTTVTTQQNLLPKLYHPHSSFSTITFPAKLTTNNNTHHQFSLKWRTNVSFFQSFLTKTKDAKPIKEELLDAIAPLDRGAEASPEDQQIIEQVFKINLYSGFQIFIV